MDRGELGGLRCRKGLLAPSAVMRREGTDSGLQADEKLGQHGGWQVVQTKTIGGTMGSENVEMKAVKWLQGQETSEKLC